MSRLEERNIFQGEISSLGLDNYQETIELSKEYFDPVDWAKQAKALGDYISSNDLQFFRSSEETEFKKLVYEIQRRNAINKKNKFVPSIPRDQLSYVWGVGKTRLLLHKDAAPKCNELIASAKKELEEQKVKNQQIPSRVEFWVQSAYRDVERELKLWQNYFDDYYDKTRKLRKKEIGGELGHRAAELLAKYISPKKAIPGYGKHSKGQAVDFRTNENGIEYTLSTNSKNVEAWKKTWFFNWMLSNASRFQFKLNPKINEPWHWEYQFKPKPETEYFVPSLPTDPLSGVTKYEHIDLHIGKALARNKNRYYTKPLTGIYIPPDFNPTSSINIIVYLHGYKFGYPSESSAIDEYWNANDLPFFAFREGLQRSGKKAILVAPTLGPKSQAGDLTRYGLDSYLDKIRVTLNNMGYNKEIGEVVLSCHSGAGYVMAVLVSHKNKYKIKQCWGFDCLYKGTRFIPSKFWLDWANKNKDKDLHIFHKSKNPQSEYTKLKDGAVKQNATNVHVNYSEVESFKMEVFRANKAKRGIKTIYEHFLIPITHWEDCITKLNWI